MTDKVTVNLEYMQEFSTGSVKLGSFSHKQISDLRRALVDAVPSAAPQCPRFLNVSFRTDMDFAQGLKPASIDTECAFMLTFDQFARRLCAKNNLVRPPSQTARFCAHNLRTGRCQDPFMRATIGAVLFPQFYAKDKQK